MGGQAGNTSYGKHRAGKPLAGLTVCLDDANHALNRHIGHGSGDDLIHAHGDLIAPELVYIADRIDMLFHNVVRRKQVGRLGNTVFIGGHAGHQVSRIALVIHGVDVKLNASNHMLIQLVLLQDFDTARSILIDHSYQNCAGIQIGAVHHNRPFLFRGVIPIGRAQLTDFIGTIGNLLEHDGAIRGGGCLLNLRVLLVKEAKHRAGKRLTVLPDFLEHHPVQFIPNHRVASHLAVRGNGKRFDRRIQRIAGGRVGLLEGIGSGNNGDIGNFTIRIGVFAEDRIAIGIVHLDQRTRQLLGSGDVGLGDRNRRVDQPIQNGLIQIDCDDIFAGRLIGRCQRDRILVRAEQPSIRNGDLLQVVIPVRVQTGEGQIALSISRTGSEQGVGGQLLCVAVGDYAAVKQAENKALAGDNLNSLVNHAVLGFGNQQVFLLLAQHHADGQVGVCGRYLGLNNRGFLIDGSQCERVRRGIKDIAIRRGNLLQVILAQRQHLGFHSAGRAGGQRLNQIILAVEHATLFADDVLGGTKFKYRSG